MSQIQWMLIVDADSTDQELVDFIGKKFGTLIRVAEDEFPPDPVAGTNIIKRSVVMFDEVEI